MLLQKFLRKTLVKHGSEYAANYEPHGLESTAMSLGNRDIQEIQDAASVFTDAKRNLRAIETQHNSGVPDAPFKESWPDLTLKKHVLDVANDPNLEWLGFTKAETQIPRYSLANHFDELHYVKQPDNTWHLTPMRNGNAVGDVGHNVPDARLEDYIGPDAAKSLRDHSTNAVEYRDGSKSGRLQTSSILNSQQALGMKHFYDNVLPSRLNKILKPFGGGVEEGKVAAAKLRGLGYNTSGQIITDPTGREGESNVVANMWPQIRSGADAMDRGHETVNWVRENQPPSTAPAWLARLTPEMKEAIKKAGLPLMTVLLSRYMSQPQMAPSHLQGNQ
jgi:hypothetical protein